ncbi:hypothetical protein WDZ92_54135, partial [Nostoc sp. NIES-2111]
VGPEPREGRGGEAGGGRGDAGEGRRGLILPQGPAEPQAGDAGGGRVLYLGRGNADRPEGQ